MRTKIVLAGLALIALSCFAINEYAQAPATHAAKAEAVIAKNLQQTNGLTVSQLLGLKRSQIALQEYDKGVHEAQKGCNCGPEIDKYTEGHHAQWCTMFASWVARESGAPVYSDKTNSWRIPNSRDFAEYLQKTGTWHSRQEMIDQHLTPQVGDFVVFWRGKYDQRLGHVDIVIANSDQFGTGDLIGGNLLDTVYFHHNLNYLEDYYPMLGFGHSEKS